MSKNKLHSISDADLAKEVNRRLTGTNISDEQLVEELSRRIGHLDQPECYDAMCLIGAAERDSMIAHEVCDCVATLLKLAREE